MKITRMGIDLGKSAFHVHAVDRSGGVVVEKRLTRRGLARFIEELEPCLIGLEACGGAHHWARRLRGMGHDARLMSPQFVKAYVKSNKNDFRDAEAICEAVSRPSMRFVPVKSVEQQDVQHLHRIRSQAVAHRTALVNQVRGILLEYGITIGKGIGQVRRRLPEVLEDADNGLSGSMRALLAELGEEIRHLDERVGRFDARIVEISRATPACRRLERIPGVGPVTSTALTAAVGDGSEFGNGRELAAWVGVVPRQRSTGGRAVLLGISKRGDQYLRSLFIHGARAALRTAARREDRRSRWALEVQHRRGTNVASVALANKNLRTAWALLTQEVEYDATAA
ncbi:MAG: IS110 family transposase [Chloroflexi bacterium]|nr:IS110 family transposase [Chloroflexota bacterium]